MEIQKQKARKSTSLLSCTSNSDKDKSIKNNKKQERNINQDITAECILSKTKTDLIEIYRVIRKHVKDSNYMFQESELKDVYQKISLNLKQIQKGINQIESLKTTSKANSICINESQSQSTFHLQHNAFDPTSISLPNCQYNSTDSVNNTGLNESSLNSENLGNMDKKLASSHQTISALNANYITKIKELEKYIQQQRELNSQEIRTLIQNNQEQMMFVEKECGIKFSNYKKQAEEEIQFIQSQLSAKIQQLSSLNSRSHQQSEQLKTLEQNIQYERSRNSVLENKLLQFKEDFKQKQGKYTEIIHKFIERFKSFKSYQTQFKQQFVAKLHKLQRFLQRFYDSLEQRGKQNNQRQLNYSKLIFKKIQELTKDAANSPGNPQNCHAVTNKYVSSKNQGNNQKMKKIVSLNSQQQKQQSKNRFQNEENFNQDEAIFDYNQAADCWLGQEHPYMIIDQESIEEIITKLFEFGFFKHQNVQNIKGLISIQQQLSQGANQKDINSHSLFPILLQKIKLTTAKNQLDLSLKDFIPEIENRKSNYSACSNLKNSMSKSNTANINMHSSNNLRRHISSIQELDVSDSMLRDDSFDQNKQAASNYADQLF